MKEKIICNIPKCNKTAVEFSMIGNQGKYTCKKHAKERFMEFMKLSKKYEGKQIVPNIRFSARRLDWEEKT